MDNMNIALFIATPLQVINGLNLIESALKNNDNIDLYYRITDEKSKFVLSRMTEYYHFRRVYTYNLMKKKISLGYFCDDFIQAVNPKEFLKRRIIENINFDELCYDIITVTSCTEMELAMVRCFPAARVLAYEDGLGSYVGDIIHDHKLNIIWRLLGRDKSIVKPELLYVNNVLACKSTMTNNIKPLLRFCDYPNFLADIKKIFYDLNGDLYSDYNAIYLTQPIREIKGFSMDALSRCQYLIKKKFKSGLLLRKHPRDAGSYENFITDTENNNWELLCSDAINSEHILIGVCSTAQLVPKLMWDKEPYLVFLYKLCIYENKTELCKNFDNIVNMLLEVYFKKDKIFVPSNFQELERALNVFEN